MEINDPTPHRRRPRYSGQYPRRYSEKYKELHPEKYPETIAKVLASGKTPAGTHIPILVAAVLDCLRPEPGNVAVDCTLGFGGHASAILSRLLPGGVLLGLDTDPVELPRTELRLRDMGFGADCFRVRRSNFAGLHAALAAEELGRADCVLADLGVSSMQLDTPARGFSTKTDGPLDMRMNPGRGISAAQFLKNSRAEKLAACLEENADEPRAADLAGALAGRDFPRTPDLVKAIRRVLAALAEDEQDQAVRRVFQALRIEINGEFSALDSMLRALPACTNPGGRIAVLAFHSGEDRRVKKAFQSGFRAGIYSEIADNVIRPGPEECRANPRATSAKLRWAVRAPQ